MIEPTIISVPDLAERWEQAPQQIIDHAMQLKLPVLFLFDGLAIETTNRWLLGHGAGDEERELCRTRKLLKDWEASLKRNVRGTPGEFERLSPDDIKKLRRSIEEHKSRIEELERLLSDRERLRWEKEYRGYIRALPDTLHQLSTATEIAFPFLGADPAYPIILTKIVGRLVWDGRLMNLERGMAPWQPRLARHDLLVPMSVVKALENPQEGPEPTMKHVSKTQLQEEEILSKLQSMGLNPKALPAVPCGKPSAKAEVKNRLLSERRDLFTKSSFDKAWQSLRDQGQIKEGE